jgi:ubiquinone/menaquinone biosynthesis C-methylase UbiE
MADRETLRKTFNQVAGDYDAVRPDYPEALVEDVMALSGIPKGGRILEIGCGSGQATVPFARRGYAMTCLDIGAELLERAREKCAAFPQVEFHNVSF